MEPDNETASIRELVSQDLTNIITTLTQSTAAAQVSTPTSMSPPAPALSPSGSPTRYLPTPPHITGKSPTPLTPIISPAQSREPSPIPVSSFSSQTPSKRGRDDVNDEHDKDDEDRVLGTKRPRKNTSTASLSSPVSSSTLNSMTPALTVVVTAASPTVDNSRTSSAFDKLWEGATPVANDISPPHDAQKYIRTSLIMLNVDTLGPDWVKLVRLWYHREEDCGFPKKGVLVPNTSKERPMCVPKWQQNARSPTWRPKDDEIESNFEEKFWKWWSDAQPHWRVNKSTLHPLRPNTLKPSMQWDNSPIANASGANGALQFLAALFMWSEVLRKKGGSIKGWVAAVRNVVWTFEHLPEVPVS